VSQQPHDVDALAETELIPRFDLSIAEVLGGAAAEPEPSAEPASRPERAAPAPTPAPSPTPATAEPEPVWPEPAEEPARPEPAAPEPVRRRSRSRERPAYEPSAEEKPAYDKPAHGKPSYEIPAQERPAYDKPAHEKPSYEKPSYEIPAQGRPSYDKPVHDKPSYDKPVREKPSYESLAYETPAQEKPSRFDSPTPEKPSLFDRPSPFDSPAPEKPSPFDRPSPFDSPWPEKPTHEEPAPEKPSHEEPAGEAAPDEEPEPTDERRAVPSALQAAHADPTLWRETVPFDETGVLLRPESLRHKAMQAETELMSAITAGAKADDRSEAAAAQRPGFWTGAWPRRALVAAILLVQALLSLRNNNTAFEDEALYLYSGHLELGHLLFGTSTGADFWSYFSGAPTLYPVLGSIADQIGGLFAARLLSLAFMLGVTGLLYLLSKRLFGTRAGLCAAGLYCCGEATVFLGGLATYDAPALFLLALAAWIVVRFAESTWPFYLLAAFPLTLAVGTKYAALIFVPVVIGLALLTSMPKSGAWALARPFALTAAVGCLLYTALKIAGPTALTGVEVTTTNRAQGTDPASLILKDSAEWGGVVFAASLVGAWFLVRLPRAARHAALPTARWQRMCLATLMVGAALLAPAYQLHLHTAVSLQKHVGFGLFFAAPLAGYGIVRLVGPNLHRVQLGIAVAVLGFALGMSQSLFQFHVWPNSNALVQAILTYQQPGANYLISSDEVEIYSLRGDPDAEPAQFSNTFYFAYTDAKGQYLTGDAAYTSAIDAGYFRVIAYSGTDSPAIEALIAEDLYHNPDYRLISRVPEATAYGTVYYYVWVRR
jgi:4-amino-4-deoxy-L-arabinose transferase-like glycosyltransferase